MHYKKGIFYRLIFVFILFSFGYLNAQTYSVGKTYFDSTGFVEYHAGNLPFVISVPHGGYLAPDSIPDRDCYGCKYVRDSYTQEIGYKLIDRFYEITGCYPHVVINLLSRKKFDANRDITDAADGNLLVEKAWYGYHAFIDSAKSAIAKTYSKGIFLDLHGHGHDIQRIEMGYLLSKSELQLNDDVLNLDFFTDKSSIRNLVYNNNHSLKFSDLLRGENSLGSILQAKGFRSVPSADNPFPNAGEPYFSGGYNTKRHGSRNGGVIDAIQLELNHDIRFDKAKRSEFVDSLIRGIIEFYDLNYNSDFDGNYCKISGNADAGIDIDNILIYPNPVNDFIYLNGPVMDLEIKIFDIFGNKKAAYENRGQALNIRNLKSGLYFIQFLKNGKYLKTLKFIKE